MVVYCVAKPTLLETLCPDPTQRPPCLKSKNLHTWQSHDWLHVVIHNLGIDQSCWMFRCPHPCLDVHCWRALTLQMLVISACWGGKPLQQRFTPRKNKEQTAWLRGLSVQRRTIARMGVHICISAVSRLDLDRTSKRKKIRFNIQEKFHIAILFLLDINVVDELYLYSSISFNFEQYLVVASNTQYFFYCIFQETFQTFVFEKKFFNM